ncbi:MAG: RNase adapter RapZ [Clostridia bacterium]|nr:RNase adapter RapZ [Clostridia bacterium]
MNIVIVTGLSGAGKSSAMKSMEDVGYYCVDNLPPVLISKFIEICQYSVEELEKIALGIDIRGGAFFEDFHAGFQELMEKGHDCKIVYVEASDESLVKRYKELRRPHPLAGDHTLLESIQMERVMMQSLRDSASMIIDTTNMGINTFRNVVREKFLDDNNQPKITIITNSFGFKKGIAIDSDLVFDVRFLPNPFYISDLRELTGNDQPVQDYVMGFEESQVFFDKTKDLITYLIPHYIKEGKTELVVSFGCTGGRHRSVTMANLMGEYLKKQNYKVYIRHRDS